MASTTLAQFRTAVAETIGLDNSVGGQQTLIDRWVNEGVEQFLLDTHCKVTSGTMTLTAGTFEYTLPSDVLLLLEISSLAGGEDYRLSRTSTQDVLRMRRSNLGDDSPTRWFAFEGADLLLIYPTPSSSGDSLTIYYVPRPTALSAVGDIPTSVPAEWHGAVEQWALYRAGDFKDDESSAQGQRYRDAYDAWVARAKRGLRGKGGRRLGPAVVNPARQHVHHRNDTWLP